MLATFNSSWRSNSRLMTPIKPYLWLPRCNLRKFNTRAYSTEPGRTRNVIGVFSPVSAFLFIATGAGIVYYFQQAKAKQIEQREKERSSTKYGRPQVGGPFTLTSHTGEPFTEQNLLGKWSFVYFGFTNCPDICPAELDKVTAIMNTVEKVHGTIFIPAFVSVDPARDSISQMGGYLKDFHPSFVGLVGSYEDTKKICKAYRVYFSTPPDADPNGDYLVDHSIFVYFMDPEGNFVDAFGQNTTAEEVVDKVNDAIVEWQQEHNGKKV